MSALALSCAVRTDTGPVRPHNEDAAFATARLAVVADGVGGHAAGEVASRTVVGALASLEKAWVDEPLEAALARAVEEGNDRIAFIAGCRPETAGMGTTLTAVALHGEYLVANIGDSRTYLLRDGELRQLTRDDSYLQELLDSGAVTPEAARTHPRRNVVTAALDGAPGRAAAIDRVPARTGRPVAVVLGRAVRRARRAADRRAARGARRRARGRRARARGAGRRRPRQRHRRGRRCRAGGYAGALAARLAPASLLQAPVAMRVAPAWATAFACRGRGFAPGDASVHLFSLGVSNCTLDARAVDNSVSARLIHSSAQPEANPSPVQAHAVAQATHHHPTPPAPAKARYQASSSAAPGWAWRVSSPDSPVRIR